MISNLIEFLMSNLFFVILIVGGIYSYFKRKVETSSRQQAPEPTHQREQGRYEPEQITKARVEERRGSQSRSDPQNKDSSIPKKADKNNLNDRTVLKQKQRSKQNRFNTASKNVLPNPNQVAQGVIWSEILGPPRSKKAHSVTAFLRQKDKL